jgi:aspartokinase/homoserine dehydrogenase 1
MMIDPNGIDLNNWEEVLKKSDLKSDPKLYIEKIKELNLSNSMFVDCTATQAYVPNYDKILSIPISIVTPNKIANSRRQFHYDSLKTIAKKNNVQFRYGTNVGAALPIINTLRDLINNGDEITKIEGVLSGTLSYIFNSLNGESSFSQVVKEAQKGGFTEPDPRDDLSGLDVARKLLILIREAQIPFEMKNVKIQNLVPKKARSVETVDEFYSILEENDKAFSSKIIKANEKNKKLCYIAKYEKGKATVGMEEISPTHSFYNLSSTDNIVAFHTKNYSEKPLVIQGPGAGAANTAFGVFIDIMRISNYLG